MHGGLLIQIVTQTCNVSEEAVRRACVIHRKRIYGNLILCNPERLSLDFFRSVHEENDTLVAVEMRRKAKDETSIHCNQRSTKECHSAEAHCHSAQSGQAPQ